MQHKLVLTELEVQALLAVLAKVIENKKITRYDQDVMKIVGPTIWSQYYSAIAKKMHEYTDNNVIFMSERKQGKYDYKKQNQR